MVLKRVTPNRTIVAEEGISTDQLPSKFPLSFLSPFRSDI